jgi:broad specificity phosphatase PhoE
LRAAASSAACAADRGAAASAAAPRRAARCGAVQRRRRGLDAVLAVEELHDRAVAVVAHGAVVRDLQGL